LLLLLLVSVAVELPRIRIDNSHPNNIPVKTEMPPLAWLG
jgi:hypothetical protein